MTYQTTNRSSTITEKELARAAMKIIRYTSDEKIGGLTVGGIARKLQVTTPNLSRAFKKHYGYSLSSLIKDRKLGICFMSLGDYENLTLKEILERLDIQSNSHFIKEFKKVLGTTPGQFKIDNRRRMKKYRASGNRSQK